MENGSKALAGLIAELCAKEQDVSLLDLVYRILTHSKQGG